jgi:uncharacterized protein
MELLIDAFRNAKQNAEILATEGNFTIAGVKKINTSSEGDYNPPDYFYDNYPIDVAEKISSPSTQNNSSKKQDNCNLACNFLHR